MPVLAGSAHAHILTKPSRAGFAVIRLELIEPGGAVGRTHIIVRLGTRIRRKDGTENFGGFVYVLEGFPQREFVLWVFMCPINLSVSFSGSCDGL